MNKSTAFILDTNILIRYLTNDTPEQAVAIETLFKKADNRSLTIPDVVLVEAVYVLLSYYELSKEELIDKVNILLTFEKFRINLPLFKKTLELYANNSISFVDAYLLVLTNQHEKSILYTLDKKLLAIPTYKTKRP